MSSSSKASKLAEHAQNAARNALAAKLKPSPHRSRLSGYLIFQKERRSALANSLESVPPTELMKRLGADWKALPDATKAEFNKKSEAENAKRKPAPKTAAAQDGFQGGSLTLKGPRALDLTARKVAQQVLSGFFADLEERVGKSIFIPSVGSVKVSPLEKGKGYQIKLTRPRPRNSS